MTASDVIHSLTEAFPKTSGQVVVFGYNQQVTEYLYVMCRRNQRMLFTFVTDTEQYNDLQQTQGRWHRVVLLSDWNAAHHDWNMNDPLQSMAKSQHSGLALVLNERTEDVIECLNYCDVVLRKDIE